MMIFILCNVILISYYLKCLIFLKMPSSEKQTLHSSVTPVALKLQVVLPKKPAFTSAHTQTLNEDKSHLLGTFSR